MTTPSRNPSTRAPAVLALLATSTLLMWLPALRTPFWGDDYVFLLASRAARMAALPWWSDFLPASPLRFWRPLSQEGYWRLMEGGFGGNALAMHAASLALHVLASASVGLLAMRMARACQWRRAGRTGVLAGLIYGTLAMHMLPVHWAAAANSSMLTLLTALMLCAWLDALCAEGPRRSLLLCLTPVLLALALLIKESAVLTPLLMVATGVFSARLGWQRGPLIALAACCLVIAGWLVLHARFTTESDPAYALTMGSNVIRNGASFLAWMANVPRESLRMAVVGDRGPALAWIAATALPMLAAWGIALRRGHSLLSPRQWLAVIVFAVLAYGPYFLFAWNSYPYYAAISAILPTIAFAHLSVENRRLWLIAALIALSSWAAVAGSRHVAQPGLIARAQWGENLLRELEQQPVGAPVWVETSDPQRFYAIGQAGLAWRLGIDPAAVHLTTRCPARVSRCLVIAEDGTWHWRETASAGPAAAGATMGLHFLRHAL